MHPRADSTHALTLKPAAGRALGAGEARFNKLLAEVQALRERITARTAALDDALRRYAEILGPAEMEEDLVRQEIILELGALWLAGDCVKQRQRPLLRNLLLAQFEMLRDTDGTASDPRFAPLAKALMEDADREDGIDAEEARAYEEVSEDLFTTPHYKDPTVLRQMDRTRFHEEMSPSEFAAEFKRQADAIHASRKQARAAQPPKPTKAELRKAAMDEAREKTLSSIFKQLVKVLHPDLERDPARQAEKHALMQRVNAAYKAQDLFTLLQLELEYLRSEEGSGKALEGDTLQVYIDVLRDQVQLLKHECANLSAQPRYATIHEHIVGTRSRNPRWADLAAASRLRIDEMRHCLAVLRSSPAGTRRAIKEMLESFKAQRVMTAFYDDPEAY